jgi:hypothetical protein
MHMPKTPRIKLQISIVAADMADVQTVLKEINNLVAGGYESAYRIHDWGSFDYMLTFQEQTEALNLK